MYRKHTLKRTKSRSQSKSRSRNGIRSKVVTGITKGMILGNTRGLKWGNIEGLTEENVEKYGFNVALKRHMNATAKGLGKTTEKKNHRYPDWAAQIKANMNKGMTLEDSIRRLRLEHSPNEKYASHKNLPTHLTKAQKRIFYKEKAEKETVKEKTQFVEWKKHNPAGTMEEFLSFRAIRKFLDKAEAK